MIKNNEIDQSQTISSVGIIGGGKVGLQLLALFSQSQLTKVDYVVDREQDALALLAAREEKIATFADFNQAIDARPTDFIFEVTGSSKVAEAIQRKLGDRQTQLITHEMAFILLRVLEDSRQKTTDVVLTDMRHIEKEILNSIDTMTSTIRSIKQTMTDLSYLAINARIEAAHAGIQGRGFDIVAQQVEKTAESVRSMTLNMEGVNTNILAVSERIESSLQRLN